MDLNVKIKEEPICCEETSNASCDNYKVTSEEMHLKEEPKSELGEPRETQLTTGIKDEICVDEHIVCPLVASFKEEDKRESTLLTEAPSNQSPIHPARQWSLSCNECGRKFSHKSAFRIHLHNQCAKRPFSCKECGYMSSKKTHLLQHVLSHSEERPYSCDVCGKKFPQISYLKRHILKHKGHHSHSCHQCSRGFSSGSSLRTHMLQHTGERPHCCAQCGKNFPQVSSLRQHILVHTGERPHKCLECNKTFSTSFQGSLCLVEALLPPGGCLDPDAAENESIHSRRVIGTKNY
ncbi:zinc finger protein 239-like [Anabrus simplex]|uniref:zinc finger protein 239-like n=1 Tax=Anabrus simplex TaxID=316456 RepID=UPI0035A39C2B